ncbi:hypothetical protein JOY44_14485 [Phormidium sp. CLA17]|nr:hypothetical protein [Leptolyngbya sp. Cla-17]
MALWFYVFTHFSEICVSLPNTKPAPSPEFWLIHWIVNLFPGLSLLILGYNIPKRLSARRQPGFSGLGWVVTVLSAIWAVGWNIAFLIVGCLGFFPAQS